MESQVWMVIWKKAANDAGEAVALTMPILKRIPKKSMQGHKQGCP
jgi:hypothetical protein